MSATPVQQTESAAFIARLLAAENDAAREELVHLSRSVDWGQIVADLTDRVRQEVHVDTGKAHLLADIAMLVAHATGNAATLWRWVAQ